MSNDLEEMFKMAAGASENQGEGEAAGKYIGGDPVKIAEKQRIDELEAKKLVEKEKATAKVVKEEVKAPASVEHKEVSVTRESDKEEPKQTPIAPPEPAKTKPIEDPVEDTIKRQQELNKESSSYISVDTVTAVIHVADAFRRLDSSVKDSVYKFFSTKDEENTIARVLGESKDTRTALLAIVSAQKASDVDRAFFLVSLDDYLLRDMGILINTYTQKKSADLDIINEKRIDYCRGLEKAIRGMSQREKTDLSAIQALFYVAK